MENNHKNEFKELFLQLPEGAQGALHWIYANIDLVVRLCQNLDMAEEEIALYLDKAQERKDYITIFLLTIARMYLETDDTAERMD